MRSSRRVQDSRDLISAMLSRPEGSLILTAVFRSLVCACRQRVLNGKDIAAKLHPIIHPGNISRRRRADELGAAEFLTKARYYVASAMTTTFRIVEQIGLGRGLRWKVANGA